jgi:hypothetical protein
MLELKFEIEATPRFEPRLLETASLKLLKVEIEAFSSNKLDSWACIFWLLGWEGLELYQSFRVGTNEDHSVEEW